MKTMDSSSYLSILEKKEEIQPLLSVIVAVYNIEAYVEKCVRSIMNQTYTFMQIILVDDGSTDGSSQICDRLARMDRRIQVIHQENGGLSNARNTGMQYMRGQYVAFVDGDDYIDQTMYEDMISAIVETKADLAVCRYKQIGQNKIVDDSSDQVIVMEDFETLEVFLKEEDSICIQNAAWNKVYNRKLLGDLQFPEGRWYEDIVYTTKLLGNSKRCVYIDRAYYNYVVDREGSIMNEALSPRILTDQIQNYKEKEAYLQSLGQEEFVKIHEFYYLKRLLNYYIENERVGGIDRLQNRKKFIKLIREKSDRFTEIYNCSVSNENEKKKMELFLKNPLYYKAFVNFNEKVRLPLNQMKKKREEGK